jgi:hypothetical protein
VGGSSSRRSVCAHLNVYYFEPLSATRSQGGDKEVAVAAAKQLARRAEKRTSVGGLRHLEGSVDIDQLLPVENYDVGGARLTVVRDSVVGPGWAFACRWVIICWVVDFRRCRRQTGLSGFVR